MCCPTRSVYYVLFLLDNIKSIRTIIVPYKTEWVKYQMIIFYY